MKRFELMVDRGTTSACAENTPKPFGASTLTRNYLRVRGEYDCPRDNGPCVMELPPRARRIQAIEQPFDCVHGTTSACAENTVRRNT